MIEVWCFTDVHGSLQEVRVQGECRNESGRIQCEIKQVLHGGRDVTFAISDRDLRAIEAKLSGQYIANRHPYGESAGFE